MNLTFEMCGGLYTNTYTIGLTPGYFARIAIISSSLGIVNGSVIIENFIKFEIYLLKNFFKILKHTF